MNLFIGLPLIVLTLLNTVQFFVAIGMAIATKSKELRKRLGIYGLGFTTFIFILCWMSALVDQGFIGLEIAFRYFFIGTFGLAAFHFHLLRNRNKF